MANNANLQSNANSMNMSEDERQRAFDMAKQVRFLLVPITPQSHYALLSQCYDLSFFASEMEAVLETMEI